MKQAVERVLKEHSRTVGLDIMPRILEFTKSTSAGDRNSCSVFPSQSNQLCEKVF